MTPLISIIIPAYNAERYVADAIKSVLSQSYAHWQLLIGDDHSTDGTNRVCQHFAEQDERIKVIRMSKHHGEANSVRNELLAMVEGEWVHELDADDTIDPDTLRTLLDVADKTGADVVSQRSVCMTEDGRRLTESVPVGGFDYDRVYTGEEACKLTIPGWRINMNGGLVRPGLLREAERLRREFVREEGFTRKLIYDDELLSRFILQSAKVVAVSPVIYNRREVSSSITRRYCTRQLDHIHVQRLVERFARRWHPELVRECEVNLWWKMTGYTCLYEYNHQCLSDEDKQMTNELICRYWHTVDNRLVRPALPLWRRLVMTYSYRLFRTFIALRCKVR